MKRLESAFGRTEGAPDFSLICHLQDGVTTMEDASGLYEVERRVRHAERDGFRISELQISSTQSVPWHFHSDIQDTFYVLEGQIRVQLRAPEEAVVLAQGETYSVRPKRPHRVENVGEGSATFLVLQGIGTYDYVPIEEGIDSEHEQ